MVFIFEAKSQVFTQVYIDKCTGEAKTAVSTSMGNGMTMLAFYNQIKIFTSAQITNGTAQSWLNQVYADYNARPCPVSNVIQQTVQAAVLQTAAAATSSVASSAVTSASTNSSNATSSSSTDSKESNADSKESSEQKQENSEENSTEEKEKEEKKEKRRGNSNPMLVSSDLATQQTDGQYSAMISAGISKSSMVGTDSWSLTSLIWTTLDQFALNGGYTKMKFEKGSLKSINSYSATAAYLKGNLMLMKGYTYIRPHPKFGTYGYNVGLINLFSKAERGYNMSVSATLLGFWTKPYQVSSKVTLSPQVFLSNTPITWNPPSAESVISKNISYVFGLSYDYKITRRFGLGLNYRFASSTYPGSQISHNFLIGSRMTL